MYIVLSIIIILLAAVIYYANMRPKKMRQYYIKALREKGYKVAEVPFNILNLGHRGIFKKD
jgi:preprotein translocase subunit YajC